MRGSEQACVRVFPRAGPAGVQVLTSLDDSVAQGNRRFNLTFTDRVRWMRFAPRPRRASAPDARSFVTRAQRTGVAVAIFDMALQDNEQGTVLLSSPPVIVNILEGQK
jgi:hypothetical protein